MFLKNKDPRLFLFERREEMANLAIPFLLLAFCALAKVVHFQFSLTHRILLTAIVGLVFMHSLHTAFTLGNLIEMPEYRNWIHDRYKGRTWLAVVQWAGLFLLVFVVSVLAYSRIAELQWFNHFVNANTLFFILMFSGYSHIGSQFMGLSLIYNQKIAQVFPLSDREKQRLRRHGKWERWLFRTIIWTGILGELAKVVWLDSYWPSLAGPFYIICAALGICLFANAYFTPYSARTNKMTFLIRTLLVIHPFIHRSVYFAGRAAHGIEYLFVCRQMRQNSRSRNSLWRVGKWSLGLGVTVALAVIGHYVIKNVYAYQAIPIPTPGKRWMMVVGSLLNAQALLHYYLDGILFRFSQPAVRAHLGPLLLKMNSEPQAILASPRDSVFVPEMAA